MANRKKSAKSAPVSQLDSGFKSLTDREVSYWASRKSGLTLMGVLEGSFDTSQGTGYRIRASRETVVNDPDNKGSDIKVPAGTLVTLVPPAMIKTSFETAYSSQTRDKAVEVQVVFGEKATNPKTEREYTQCEMGFRLVKPTNRIDTSAADGKF